MIVCHCKGVSDRTIRKAVRDGARSPRQVGAACNAGRSCGGCQPAIHELIESESQESFGPVLLSVARVSATG